MRIKDIKETPAAELLPKSKTPKADSIGRSLARIAIERFGNLNTDGVTYHHTNTKEDPQARAKQLAGLFHQEMLNAIDDEFKRQGMVNVSPKKSS